MKLTIRIIYIASAIVAFLSFAAALLITVFQKPILALMSAPEVVLSTGPIICPTPLLNLLQIGFFSLLTVIACEVFRKGFWPEIVLLIPIVLFAFGLPDVIATLQQAHYGSLGAAALTKYSLLSSCFSIPTKVGEVSTLLQVLACGLSIGRKVGDRKLEKIK